jgi:hypothetical protein
MVLGSSRIFRIVSIGDFLSGTLNIVNDMSVSIVLMSSSQWSALFRHLRYIYMVNIKYPTKQVRTTQLVELVRIKLYNYAL